MKSIFDQTQWPLSIMIPYKFCYSPTFYIKGRCTKVQTLLIQILVSRSGHNPDWHGVMPRKQTDVQWPFSKGPCQAQTRNLRYFLITPHPRAWTTRKVVLCNLNDSLDGSIHGNELGTQTVILIEWEEALARVRVWVVKTICQQLKVVLTFMCNLCSKTQLLESVGLSSNYRVGNGERWWVGVDFIATPRSGVKFEGSLSCASGLRILVHDPAAEQSTWTLGVSVRVTRKCAEYRLHCLTVSFHHRKGKW